MNTPKTPSRKSVLGKRSSRQNDDTPSSPATSSDCCDASSDYTAATSPADGSPCPKKLKSSSTIVDDGNNKENIPPFRGEVINNSPRSIRSLRRTTTEFHTPSRPRTTPRRHASLSHVPQTPTTPASAISLLAIETPPCTPSGLTLPIHARTRALLRATCNSSASIAGRDSERTLIRDFVASFLKPELAEDDLANPVLYISGSPGCGKTALVNNVLTAFEVEMLEQEVNLVMVNCMAMNGLDAVWDRLLEAMGDTRSRGRKGKSCDLVDGLLKRSETKCILVLDEMDHVAKTPQALTALFSLAQQHASKLRIVGIANTHTLTSSSNVSLQGVSGVKTVHFAPYEPSQLLEILHSRLAPLTAEDSKVTQEVLRKFLPLPTITLLSKKIAAQTGDVRAVFEVLRGAIDIAVVHASSALDFSDDIPPTVTPAHILTALQAYAPAAKVTAAPAVTKSPFTGASHNGVARPKASGSATVTQVRNLGIQARLVLLALLVAHKRLEAGLSSSSTSSSSVTRSPSKPKRSSSSSLVAPANMTSDLSMDVAQLHTQYITILGRDDAGTFTPVSRSEFSDLAGMLETHGLVTLSSIASVPGSPSKSKARKLSRSSSFGGGKAMGAQQVIKLADCVRMDEVLKGLGVEVNVAGSGTDVKVDAEGPVDVCEEEMRAVWEAEMTRIRKESKALVAKGRAAAAAKNVFDDAMES